MPINPGALHALVVILALFCGLGLHAGIAHSKYRRKISKLYLNFRAVMDGLVLDLLEADDFDEAIICCTQSEMDACSAMGLHKVGVAIVEKARREGRLIFQKNAGTQTTIGAINRRLERFKCQQIAGEANSTINNLTGKPSILVNVQDTNQTNQIRVFWVRPRDPNNPTNTLLTGTHLRSGTF